MKIEIKEFLNRGKSLAKIPRILVKRLFLSCLLFFLFSLALGGILFYKYVFLAQKVKPEVFQRESLLKEDIYKEVLKIWQEHERKFNEADSKEYPDPFIKQVVLPEESPE